MQDPAGRGQADGRQGLPAPVAWARDQRGAGPPSWGLGGPHPPAERLEGVAYGWLVGPSAERLRAHAAVCPTCGARLAREQELRRQLALLRTNEPRVDVVAAVQQQLPAGPSAAPAGH